MNEDVGILIGRFQTPVLLEGHREVLSAFLATEHGRHVIVLGVPALKATRCNPFDFGARKRMLQNEYGNDLEVMYMKDCNGDLAWSQNLDDLISSSFGRLKVKLYGTDENVIGRYRGFHPVERLETTAYLNWQEYCRERGRASYDLASWMQGVAWAVQNRYPTAFATVDCAIFDDDNMDRMWMARKPQEECYRFVGGFVDPALDDSHEDAAVREAREETGMECEVNGYLGSFKIDDWRYRDEDDKIITSLFSMVRRGGVPKPDDDIGELRLVDLHNLPEGFEVMPEHQVMFDKIVHMVNDKA